MKLLNEMMLKIIDIWRGILICELNFQLFFYLLLEKLELEKKLLMNYLFVKIDFQGIFQFFYLLKELYNLRGDEIIVGDFKRVQF